MSKQERHLFKDKEHLVRMAGIFAVGIALFLVLQLTLIPKSFGLYGHYRADAISEEAKKPLSYAGRASCATCHASQVGTKAAGKHAGLGCEACHGPLTAHAANPAHMKPAKLDAKSLCPVCHELNAARPKWLKQVKSVEHSSGEAFNTCHQPHAPQM
jgi:hypothetical protein